jgi:hypothetical protein
MVKSEEKIGLKAQKVLTIRKIPAILLINPIKLLGIGERRYGARSKLYT